MYINTKHRIFGLDLVRAIAIIMVVFSHAIYVFQGYDNAFIDFMTVIGVDGVEVFFVLSGFLIGGILLRLINETDFSKKVIFNFWIRRWFRTLPLYFLMLLVNVVVAIFVGYELPTNLWKYALFLQNFSTYHELFFPESWSLSIEEYAYLIAPVCLYVSNKILKNKEKTFIIVSFYLVVFFLLIKVYYQSTISYQFQSMQLWNSHLKSIVIYRLDSIFYGFILAYYFYKYKSKIEQIKKALFIFGAIISGAILFIIPFFDISIEVYPFYWNVMYLPLNSIGITLMLPYLYFLRSPNEWLAKLIKSISLYSYAMYLLHYTFILYLFRLCFDFQNLSLIQRILCTVFYLLITYILSKSVYVYFEKPFTDIRDSKSIKNLFGF